MLPAWKNCYYQSCDEDDFERLFLPGDDALLQSSRLNQNHPFLYQSTTAMMYPQQVILSAKAAPSCSTMPSMASGRGRTTMLPKTSMTKQEDYGFNQEMNVNRTPLHDSDDDGNHGFFVSSVSQECPLFYHDNHPHHHHEDDNEGDQEDIHVAGLSDQDRWELKLLYSTIHHDPQDQSPLAYLWSPNSSREPQSAQCVKVENQESHQLHSSDYYQEPLLQFSETTIPHRVVSTDTQEQTGASSSSLSEEIPSPSHDFQAAAKVPQQRKQDDPHMKPIFITSLATEGDHPRRSNHTSLTVAQRDARQKQDSMLLDTAKVTHHDSPPPVEDGSSISSRFRIYQEDQWMEQYRELQDFAKETGHTFVPCGYPDRDSLARWTKRQRYQYKLRLEGKVSTMTKERISLLDKLGFIWNSQVAVWEKRLGELKQYKRLTGHCNVPSHFAPNQKLATWVKCQRRQYKLLMTGRKSNMTLDRAKILENLGFVWELRCHLQRTNSCNERH